MNGTRPAPSRAIGDGDRSGRRVPPWVVDALLGVIVTLSLGVIIAIGEGGSRRPDAIAYLFAAGFGALMLLRRQLPLAVLALSVLGLFAYYTFDYPPIGVAVPVVAALLSSAEAGRLRSSAGAAALVLVVSMSFRLRDGGETVGFVLGHETVSNLALFAAAIALGYSLRTRRIRERQQAEITRLLGERHAREAQLRLQGERERLSRELHDTVGHTMSVISLQSAVAAEAVGEDDRVVAGAVEDIREASTRSLRELRSLVRILRAGEPADDERGTPSLASAAPLVDATRAAGIEVRTDIDVEPAALPTPVDTAAYRVIQESLTNVIRHSGARHARVAARLRGGDLLLTITDDGRGRAPDDPATGYGIIGMSERVRLLGGTLTTTSDDGGFRVEATIPGSLP